MATLYRLANGQLVIDTSLPPGGSVVTLSATNNAVDLVPWYRQLDTSDLTEWHPAKYYTGLPEGTYVVADKSQGNVSIGDNTTGLATSAYGSNNIAFGSNALSVANSGKNYNIAIGKFALENTTTGDNNVAIGYKSLQANLGGTHNIAIGYKAANAVTSGLANIAMGPEALSICTSGYGNFAFGQFALSSLSTGFNNIAIGTNTLAACGGNNNVVLGSDTAQFILGSNNIILGSGGVGNAVTLQGCVIIGPISPGLNHTNEIFIADGVGNLRLSYVNSGNSWQTSAGIKSSSATSGMGYMTGAGGTVTQSGTTKTTGVTLNKICGLITMNAENLAADVAVGFVFTNSSIESDDMVLVMATGNNGHYYTVSSRNIATGSCSIVLRNVSTAARAETVLLNFMVLKSATT